MGAETEYSAVLRALSSRLESSSWELSDWTDGPLAWRVFRPPGMRSPAQGWKIHISAAASECPAMLRAVGGVLAELHGSFKLPRRVRDVVYLNSGDAGVTQLGKIVTVYPRNDSHAAELIRRLDAAWPSSCGPWITTDLSPRAGSAIGFRFGIFGTAEVITSATGEHHFALSGVSGEAIADVRSAAGPRTEDWPEPPVPGVPQAACAVEPGAEFALEDGRRFLPLEQMANAPRAAVYLAADLASLDTVVVKVGRPGVLGGLDGRDIHDHFQYEYELLRELAAETNGGPRPIAWADAGWPILICEDIRGRLVSELPRAERIAALPLIAESVSAIHRAGVVHGDIKLENAIRTEEGVRLIDFELAARRGEPMRRGGTRGHIAPEVDREPPADFSRDVYALAGCIFHAVLGMPPGLLPLGAERQKALLLLEGEAAAARLVQLFAAENPDERPDARTAAKMLAEFAAEYATRNASGKESSRQSVATEGLRRWSMRAAREAGMHVHTYARPQDSGLCWRNEHALRYFDCEAINLGAAGILLGLVSLDEALGRDDFADPIARGARWLAEQSPEGKAAGLFTGNAGVALALTVVGRRLGCEDLEQAARDRFAAAAGDLREIDLFSGIAGVIWTACLLHDVLGEDWPLEMVQPAVEHLQSQRTTREGILFWTVDPEQDTCFLGCAHGSAGVALALAAYGKRTSQEQLIAEALSAFEQLGMLGRTPEGDALRMTVEQARHHAIGNWCHGIAGYLWSILQGVGDHPALREVIDWSVEQLAGHGAIGTPTYCHGLAGQLELWQMLAALPRFRELANRQADRAAAALRAVHHKVEGRCVWISDDPDVTTPDLWVGFLGPATSLALYAAGVQQPLLSGSWLRACGLRGPSFGVRTETLSEVAGG